MDLASIRLLEEWFQSHISQPYPNHNTKVVLSNQTNYSVAKIGKWFRNRRNKLNNIKSSENKNQLSLKSKIIISDFFVNVNKNPTNEQLKYLSECSEVNIKQLRARFSYLRFNDKQNKYK